MSTVCTTRLVVGSILDRSAACWLATPSVRRRAAQLSAVGASVGPMATLLPELLVTDPAALRAWLEEHHATSPGVRLVLTKKGGSDTTITWASAVEELLCFGWIDGQAGKRDEGSYTV